MSKRDDTRTQQSNPFADNQKQPQESQPPPLAVGADLLRRVDNLLGRKQYEDDDDDATSRPFHVHVGDDGTVDVIGSAQDDEATVYRGRLQDVTRPRVDLKQIRQQASVPQIPIDADYTRPRAVYPRNPLDTSEGADTAAFSSLDDEVDATYYGGYQEDIEDRTQHISPKEIASFNLPSKPTEPTESPEPPLFYEEEDSSETQQVSVIKPVPNKPSREDLTQTLLEDSFLQDEKARGNALALSLPSLSRESGEQPQTFEVEKTSSTQAGAARHLEENVNTTIPKLQPLTVEESFDPSFVRGRDSLKATLLDEPKPVLHAPHTAIRPEQHGHSGQMPKLPQIKAVPSVVKGGLDTDEKDVDWSETVIRASSLKPHDYESHSGIPSPLRPAAATITDTPRSSIMDGPLAFPSPPSSTALPLPVLPTPPKSSPPPPKSSPPPLKSSPPPPPPKKEALEAPPSSSLGQSLPFAAMGQVAPQMSVTRTFVKGAILPRKKEDGTLVPVAPEEKDRYEPLQILGEGGVGQVLLVRDHDILRLAAMKCIKGSKSDTTLMRFIEEIRHTGQLEHPNIVPIHDVGVNEDGQYYFIMKYVQGEDLSMVIQKLREGDPEYHKRYTFERRARIFLEIVEAIRFAHNKGIIHRDLKPGNIRIGEFGEVAVMDWGLSKVLKHKEGGTISMNVNVLSSLDLADQRLFETRQGILVGTPAYMSPEQAYGRHDSMDQRSDIYSLGVLFYEFVTLMHPFERYSSLESLLQAITQTDPPPAWSLTHPAQGRVPRELGFMISKAMAREVEDRYQSLEPWAKELEAYLDARSGVYCTSTFIKRGVQGYTHLLDSHRVIGVTLICLVVLSSVFGSVQFVRWLVSLMAS
ncbi:MAG: serine/threonine protein kinase [Myxococcales bacterium]|nr:serine/threonine protein kinase [Myxococcales bacterium]